MNLSHFNHVLLATLCLLAACRVSNAHRGWFVDGVVEAFQKSTEFIKDITYCSMVECCPASNSAININGLHRNLSMSLFGQHIVIETLVKGLRSHYESGSSSKKPLVLSFHGPPGTGKNFVADRVASFIYPKGLESRFVHKFMGRVAYPVNSRVEMYKIELYDQVVAALKMCPRSLFIFDEVDKMPEGIFDILKSLLDYHGGHKGLNTREAVFIFLSNAGGIEISGKLLELLESGKTRASTRLADFDQILLASAYNVDGGLKNTHMIQSHLIDHFVPFLPLEQRHVLQCISAEFESHKRTYNPAIAEKVLNEHVTYQWEIFSTTGCKRLSKLVGLLAN